MSITFVRLALLALPALSPAAANDWPQWRGPAHDGVSSEKGWSATGKEPELWRAEVGLGYSNVAVANGRLFTKGFDAKSEKDVIVCLDALSGAVRWSFAYPSKLWDTMHEGGTLTTPAVDGERVFVLSRLGTLRCLEAATGKVLFEKTLASTEEELGTFGLASSPLVLDEAVIVNIGRTLALDKTSGKTLWETKDYGYSYAVPMPFEHGGRALLAVFNGSGLAVLERKSGAEVALYPWKSEYNVNSAMPIVVEGSLFISTGYNKKGCALLELEDGEGKDGAKLEPVWQSSEMNNTMTGCVLFDGLLYGFDDAVLKCLTPGGDAHWSERGLGKGTLMASDGRLIVLSEKGELSVAPAGEKGFTPLFRRQLFTEGVCWTTPVLANGVLYCRNSKGTLIALDHRGTSTH